MRATGSIEEDFDAQPETYEDGRELCWRFHAETRLERPGFCSLADIRRVLGYGDRYYFRIPGGLRKLTEAQFAALLQRFR